MSVFDKTLLNEARDFQRFVTKYEVSGILNTLLLKMATSSMEEFLRKLSTTFASLSNDALFSAAETEHVNRFPEPPILFSWEKNSVKTPDSYILAEWLWRRTEALRVFWSLLSLVNHLLKFSYSPSSDATSFSSIHNNRSLPIM